MNTLYFVRHAESEANSQRILASQLPFPLTRAGRIDAARIASELKDLADIGRIITSPLVRARQTAAAFERVFHVNVEVDERVIEQNLGIYSGMTYDEVKSNPGYETDSLERWSWHPDGGGESYSEVAERITSFLTALETEKGESNVLIVTHAVTLRLIRAALEDTLPEYPAAFPNNGEILRAEFRGLGHHHSIESIFLGNSREFNHNP